MKGSARTVLACMAAFTMGVICTGVFVFLQRQSNPPKTEAPVAVPADESDVEPEPPRRNTFQRMPRPPIEQLPPIEEPRAEEVIEPPPLEPEETAAAVVLPVRTEVRQIVTSASEVGVRGGVAESGRISGTVRLLNEPPNETRINPDPTCGGKWEKLNIAPYTRFYVLGKDRGLADVVISLRLDPGAASWRPVPRPHKIRTEACLFEPYVSAVQAGQTVLVENRDTILHNLHLMSRSNGEYNRAQFKGHSTKFEFEHPEEFVTLKCDVHPWEFAYITVFAHPYFAVTDKNGNFVIQGVPPGNYTLEARHRKAGTLLKEITLEPNRNFDVQFEFQAPALDTASARDRSNSRRR